MLTLAMQQQDSKDFTTPLNTQVPPIRHGAGSTPRASTKEEAEEERKRRRHSIRSNASNASVHEGKTTPSCSSRLEMSTADFFLLFLQTIMIPN